MHCELGCRVPLCGLKPKIGGLLKAFADRRTCPGFAPIHGLSVSGSKPEEVGDAHETASARSTQGLLSNDLYALLGTPAKKAS